MAKRNAPKSGRMQDILNWSLSMQDGADRPDTSGPMDPERRAFLEQVLQDMSLDVVDGLRQHLDTLTTSTELDAQIEAAVELHDLVESIDLANNLHQIGGFQPILRMLRQAETAPELVWRLLDIMATVVQNNPQSQQIASDLDIMEAVFPLLSRPAPQVVAKALRTVSCLVRGHEGLRAQFVAMGGAGRCVALLQAADAAEAVVVKSSVVLYHVLRADLANAHELVDPPALAQSAKGVLERSDTSASAREQLSKLLCTLAVTNPAMLEALSAHGYAGLAEARIARLEALPPADRDAVREEGLFLGKLQAVLSGEAVQPEPNLAADQASAPLALGAP